MAFQDKRPAKRVTTGIRSTNEYYGSKGTSAISRGMRGSRPSGAPNPAATTRLMSADAAYYKEKTPWATEPQGNIVSVVIRDQRELKQQVEYVLGLIRQGKSVSIQAPAEGHDEIRTTLRNAAQKAGVLKKFKVQLLTIPDATGSVVVTDAPPDPVDSERRLPKKNVDAPLVSDLQGLQTESAPTLPDMSGGALQVTDSNDTIGAAAVAAFKGAQPDRLPSNEPSPTFDAAGTVNITEPPAKSAEAMPLSEDDAAAIADVPKPTRRRRGNRFATTETEGNA